jgi:hypothetical protein
VTVAEDDEDEEEKALRLALEMSLMSTPPDVKPQSTTNAPSTSSAATSANTAESGVLDADFVNQLLGSVDADMNDPLILAALQQLNSSNAEKKDDEKEGPENNKKQRHG